MPAHRELALLYATRHRFTFTPLVLWLILLHCIILMIGGKYTYALVPAGDWVADWQFALTVLAVLGISAAYELIEWWVALLSEEAAESFLGTQGYVWDTQSDMFMALIGAVTALLMLGRWHDRQLGR